MQGKVKHILYVWCYYQLKRQLLLLVILLVFAGLVCPSANGAGFGRGFQPKRIDNVITLLTERLQLTSEQQKQVRPIIESACEKVREFFEKAEGQDRTARRRLRSERNRL